MAVTFFEEQKKSKNLIIILVIVILITLGILAQWLIRTSLTKIKVSQPLPVQFQAINIDFTVFENPALEGLQPFEVIKEDEKLKIFRENPFLPY